VPMKRFPRIGLTLSFLALTLASRPSPVDAQRVLPTGSNPTPQGQSPDDACDAANPAPAMQALRRPPPGSTWTAGPSNAAPLGPTMGAAYPSYQNAAPASNDDGDNSESPMRTSSFQPPGTAGVLEQHGLKELEESYSSVLGRLTHVENQLGVIKQPAYPTFRISGFEQTDVGTFSQDANSRKILGNIQNGVDFRRARLMAVGNLTEQTQYWFELDFAAAGRPSFMDVWVQQQSVPFFGNVRIGQYRQPVTLDGAVNVRHLEFIEYSSSFSAFDPFRRVGMASWFLSEDERTFVNYGIYGTGSTFYNGTNPSNGGTVNNSLGGDDRFATSLSDTGASFAARGTRLLYYDPLADNRYFLHVGAGYNFSQIGGNGSTGPDARSYQARTIPEFFMGDPAAGGTILGGTPNVLDTGRFLANNFSIYHLETCGSYGPAHFQAEWVATTVNQVNGPLVFLDGAYFQCGYFLTGENVGYNKFMGAIDYNVKPFTDFFGLGRRARMGGWGAWEVACRVSYLDLNGSNIKASNQLALPPGGASTNPFTTIPGLGGINQGQMTDVTVALNWWWNPFTRLQLNYIHNMVQSKAYGFNAMDIVCARAQFEF
ncbi:MAG TPA: porin, partial [Pirellulales bacterium]|nr:porin [Pirellulales bacterium]